MQNSGFDDNAIRSPSSEMSPNSPAIDPYVVQAPFNAASSRYDCILQSSDEAHFYVAGDILALSSPIFHDMFSLPQPHVTSTSGEPPKVPIISIAEDAPTLNAFLLMIYPGKSPVLTPKLAVKVAAAFDKYDVSLDRLRLFIHELYRQPDTLKSNGLELYALAWKLGMEAEARKASRYTHGVDLLDETTVQNLVSWSGSIKPLVALSELRARRERALDELVAGVYLRRGLCPKHGGHSEKYSKMTEDTFRIQVEAFKVKGRKVLEAADAQADDLMDGFGMLSGCSPTGDRCHTCFRSNFDIGKVTEGVAYMLDKFPREIARFSILR